MNKDGIFFDSEKFIARSHEGADLHLHTTTSDGTLKPSELVLKSHNPGLTTIAITDHDSTSGLGEAITAGKELDIEIIPGIELSAQEGEGEVHILGYFVDPANHSLQQVLLKMLDTRKDRARKMVEKLNSLGVEISITHVQNIYGGRFFGRLHIARAMRECGFIEDTSKAFTEKYIGTEGRAYIPRFKITPQKTIQFLHEGGGLAVLAHPGYLGDRSSLDEDDILHYAESGIDGLEVYYSRHTFQQIEWYRFIALKHELLITGGSDCHGENDGFLGSIRLDKHYVEKLKEVN